MATIFKFKPSELAVQPAVERFQHAACEIIVFPGVRYERWADPAALNPAQSSATKSRTTKSCRAKSKRTHKARGKKFDLAAVE